MNELKTFKFQKIEGGKIDKSRNNIKLRKELSELADKYACGIDRLGKYCIYGYDHDGGKGILYWIRKCEEEELKARQMTKIINDLGGDAEVMLTEDFEKNQKEYSDHIINI